MSFCFLVSGFDLNSSNLKWKNERAVLERLKSSTRSDYGGGRKVLYGTGKMAVNI